MRELPIASQLSTDMRSVCSDVHRFPCSVDQPQAVSVTLQARCAPLVCSAPCYLLCNDALCSVVCILGCPSHHICSNLTKLKSPIEKFNILTLLAMLGRLPRALALCLLVCRHRLLVHKTTSPPPLIIYMEIYAELWRMKKHL